MSEGGFGGLGIGNPGSYGGGQSTTSPGFGGGYGEYAGSTWHTALANAWNQIRGKLPQVGAGLLGTLAFGPLGGMLGYKGAGMLAGSGLLSGGDGYDRTPESMSQETAKDFRSSAASLGTLSNEGLVAALTEMYGPASGPDRLDTENTMREIVQGKRGRDSDSITANIYDMVDQVRSWDGGPVSLTTNNDAIAASQTPVPTPPGQTNPGDGTMSNPGTTPFTLTLADLVSDPRYAMYKDASQQNWQTSRDNIMSFMPQGGQLLDRLAGLESDKASFMTNALGTMSQDIADKSYGKDLAQMGANLTLQGYNTQKDIADDAQMNDMLTMIGYGLASK